MLIVNADPGTVVVTLPPDLLAKVASRAAHATKSKPAVSVADYITKAVAAYVR